jgi:putative membrane protein
MNAIFWLKALHVVGFVSWFAGLFYLVRIFVYHVEADEKDSPEREILTRQFILMEQRVYGIISNPALVITWVAGLGMLAIDLTGIASFGYFVAGTPGWMIVKLIMLIMLTGYHLYCGRLIKIMEIGKRPHSAWQLRLLNEVPTLLLVAISFVAVFGKGGRLHYGYLALGLLLFSLLVYRGAQAYRRRRNA